MNEKYKTWEYLQKCDGGMARPNDKSMYLIILT